MNVVIKVDADTKKKMLEYYKPMMRDKVIPYVVFQAQDLDTVITMYESGKVMFQGTSADIDASMWQDISEVTTKKEQSQNNQYYYISAVGSDEVGTGDYFGPIVVTSALVNKEEIPFLEELKVSDSKKLTDELILQIVPKLIKKIKYKSIILNNSDYNKIHSQDYNMNKIKAILHNQVLLQMMKEENPKVDHIIVDEFAKENRYYGYLEKEPEIQRKITFLTKAEDKNLAVAAASLISRYIFIKEFDKLSDQVGLPLPKGAGKNVDDMAKEAVTKHGQEILEKIAKLNFMNTTRILKDS